MRTFSFSLEKLKSMGPKDIGASVLTGTGVYIARKQYVLASRKNKVETIHRVRLGYKQGIYSIEEGMEQCKEEGVCSRKECFGSLLPEEKISQGTQTNNLKTNKINVAKQNKPLDLASITLTRGNLRREFSNNQKPHEMATIGVAPDSSFAQNSNRNKAGFGFETSTFLVYFCIGSLGYLSIIQLIKAFRIDETKVYKYIKKMFIPEFQAKTNDQLETLDLKLDRLELKVKNIQENQILILKNQENKT